MMDRATVAGAVLTAGRSEKVAGRRAPSELVLRAEHRQAVAHRLLDLRLELWVLRQQLVVDVAAELRVLVQVLHLLLRRIARAHEAGGAGAELREFVQVVADILALVEDVHHLLHLRELLAHGRLVEVGLHDRRQLVELGLPEGHAVDEVQVVRPVRAQHLRVEGVELHQDVVARVLRHRHIGPRRDGGGDVAGEGQQGPRHRGAEARRRARRGEAEEGAAGNVGGGHGGDGGGARRWRRWRP
mmetsp:Transcript_90278/g.251165  ORF Transcript_90278/g.251165 Transcript_90278/m.251165 type:complete len:243 (-) Transcript_90278:9-737(-)